MNVRIPDRRAKQKAEKAQPPARITIKKNGATSYPWQVYCSRCRSVGEVLMVISGRGVGALNTRGVGNSSWSMALRVGLAHLRRGC